MSSPTVTSVAEASPASDAGLQVGDELLTLNGRRPTDVIELHQLSDDEQIEVVVRNPTTALTRTVQVTKDAGVPLGIGVSSAVFDRIHTCDNHCAFCFIYQLPKGMRRSLYLKDDDYRLSFLYGNFTTLTRFTELDAERVLDERLGPLFVSIHATDPDVRASMLRNPKGATSLRWLSVLLAGGIEVHGQVVLCPGVNDGPVLEDTMLGILDEFSALASVGVVPLGVSRYSSEPSMRPHTRAEAADACTIVARWQDVFTGVLGRPLVHASDELYLRAGVELPPVDRYEGFPQHENGVGMVRAFEERFWGHDAVPHGVRPGFFASVDGAPAAGYRAPRAVPGGSISAAASALAGSVAGSPPARPPSAKPITILTGAYAAPFLTELVERHGAPGIRVLSVDNDFFGGNIAVAGLLTGTDLARTLAAEPEEHRYLLPDACLSEGRFLDGMRPSDLPRPVEIVPTDGRALRRVLDEQREATGARTGTQPPEHSSTPEGST